MIGNTILHYQILEKLGEGGMGVVYKAEDTRLKREVALKFLPTNALQGKEEKERFTREAQAAAVLNHANICHIYAIEEFDDRIFIAMEFIEGKSIEDMLVGANGPAAAGPLRLDEAIDYATQIAAGLQAAHEKGITHRDIKSANIMVTDKGVVKIMDFGLAKLSDRTKMTVQGTTLGTAAYMSPEQAQGTEIDHRSDIWSLGVVLYEMLSGQLPFKGDYEQAVIYSILHEEPEPLTALRSGLPIALDGIIAKTLAKDPKTRYQHVDELPADLKGIELNGGGISRVTKPSISEPPTSWLRQGKLWGMVALVALAAFGAGLVLKKAASPEPPGTLYLPIAMPSDIELGSQTNPNLALSPDGRQLVYSGKREGKIHLYLQDLSQPDSFRHLKGTEGAMNPFFSPDGQWLGFTSHNMIKKIALAGGDPVALADVTANISGISWTVNDEILFVPGYSSGIWKVSANGGRTEQVTTPSPGSETGHTRPQMLPGGRAILYTIYDTRSRIAVYSLDTGKQTILYEGGFHARYVPTGHIVFAQRDALLAMPFDLQQLEVGRPVLLLDNINTTSSEFYAEYTVSENGTLAYLSGASELEKSLLFYDRAGVRQPFTQELRSFGGALRFSPDGRQLAVRIQKSQANADVWIYDLLRGDFRQLNFNPAWDQRPLWTGNGQKIVFASERQGVLDLFWKPADGSGQSQALLMSEYSKWPTSWSPDDNLLIFHQTHPETGYDLWTYSPDLPDKPAPFLVTPFNENEGMFSPDGNRIVYQSDESGQNEIYVKPYPGPGGKWKVSNNGGERPRWSADGKEIFYRENHKAMVARVEKGSSFSTAVPQILFDGLERSFDISPDGKLFVTTRRQKARQLNLVLNWFEELQRKVSGGKL